MTDEARATFVEHAAGVFAAQGFPPMPARVLMALTASDDGRLTSEELQEQLGVSAAAISGAVRYLQTVGFVLRATLPGGRRHVYRLNGSTAWYTATLDRSEAMRHIVSVFREGLGVLPEASPAHSRIADMVEFFEFLDRRMPQLLTEWEAIREQRGAGGS